MPRHWLKSALGCAKTAQSAGLGMPLFMRDSWIDGSLMEGLLGAELGLKTGGSPALPSVADG